MTSFQGALRASIVPGIEARMPGQIAIALAFMRYAMPVPLTMLASDRLLTIPSVNHTRINHTREG